MLIKFVFRVFDKIKDEQYHTEPTDRRISHILTVTGTEPEEMIMKVNEAHEIVKKELKRNQLALFQYYDEVKETVICDRELSEIKNG